MWAGGKTRLIKKYKEENILPESFDQYIEPFLGAGAMFIWAYDKNPKASFVLNDHNQGIIEKGFITNYADNMHMSSRDGRPHKKQHLCTSL